jgi:glyoxylase-like metal-dependent hydrolase (beta-lactamase superfamily II)
MHIAPGVHQIVDTFVNLYLLEDEGGLTLIDAGFGRGGRKVLTAMTALEHQPQDMKRIVITHCDGDHVGGVAALKAKTGARVYASPIEAAAMAAGHSSREMRQDTLGGKVFRLVRFLFRFVSAQADEMLCDGMTLPVLGGLRVIGTPGHTPGHLSYYLPSRGILFSGDSIITQNGKLTISHGTNTWDAAQAVASARMQATLGATVVCPGHGIVVRGAGTIPS